MSPRVMISNKKSSLLSTRRTPLRLEELLATSSLDLLVATTTMKELEVAEEEEEVAEVVVVETAMLRPRQAREEMRRKP